MNLLGTPPPRRGGAILRGGLSVNSYNRHNPIQVSAALTLIPRRPNSLNFFVRQRCAQLGLKIVDPTTEQLLAAGSHPRTALSNDRALRSACVAETVDVMWGLQLMLQLVDAGGMTEAEAVAVAEAVHAANPAHITAKILAEFKIKAAPKRTILRRPTHFFAPNLMKTLHLVPVLLLALPLAAFAQAVGAHLALDQARSLAEFAVSGKLTELRAQFGPKRPWRTQLEFRVLSILPNGRIPGISNADIHLQGDRETVFFEA